LIWISWPNIHELYVIDWTYNTHKYTKWNKHTVVFWIMATQLQAHQTNSVITQKTRYESSPLCNQKSCMWEEIRYLKLRGKCIWKVNIYNEWDSSDSGLTAGFVATAMIIRIPLHRNFFCQLNCLMRTSFLGTNLEVIRGIQPLY
jgi:hypothetical protein